MAGARTDLHRPEWDVPRALVPQAAPYLRASLQAKGLIWSLVAAAAGLAMVGWVFYGPRVPLLAITGLAVAATTEGLCAWVRRPVLHLRNGPQPGHGPAGRADVAARLNVVCGRGGGSAGGCNRSGRRQVADGGGWATTPGIPPR